MLIKMPHFRVALILEERIPSKNCKFLVTETFENMHLTTVNALCWTKINILSLNLTES